MIEPTVFLVDDDAAALDSLQCLLSSVGLKSEAYSCPSDFLTHYDPSRPGCVVLDIRMPEMSGLDVQEEMTRRGRMPPVIIVTGHADVPVCAAAFRGGAFDFIEKPANHQLLLGRIQRAIQHDLAVRKSHVDPLDAAVLQQCLTPREQDVMQRIVSGKTLKQISGELSVSIQTAAKHRARILEKLNVATDVDLTRLVLMRSAVNAVPAEETDRRNDGNIRG